MSVSARSLPRVCTPSLGSGVCGALCSTIGWRGSLSTLESRVTAVSGRWEQWGNDRQPLSSLADECSQTTRLDSTRLIHTSRVAVPVPDGCNAALVDAPVRLNRIDGPLESACDRTNRIPSASHPAPPVHMSTRTSTAPHLRSPSCSSARHIASLFPPPPLPPAAMSSGGRYGNSGHGNEKLHEAQRKVDDVKGIMHKNIGARQGTQGDTPMRTGRVDWAQLDSTGFHRARRRGCGIR